MNTQTIETLDTSMILPSPVGDLILTCDGRFLTGLQFLDVATQGSDSDRDFTFRRESNEDNPIFAELIEQLNEYFSGRRLVFQLKKLTIRLDGTDFQKRVWNELSHIPYGQTISYGELARRIGQPSASRAVGLANGRNPISILVPCHRVIGTNGKLVGYGGGLDRKRKLLEVEGIAG